MLLIILIVIKVEYANVVKVKEFIVVNFLMVLNLYGDILNGIIIKNLELSEQINKLNSII